MDPKLIFPFTVNSCMINFTALPMNEFKIYSSILDKTNYLASITLNGYLRTYNSVDWGINQHPKENGHKIVADFLLAQIKERYILT